MKIFSAFGFIIAVNVAANNVLASDKIEHPLSKFKNIGITQQTVQQPENSQIPQINQSSIKPIEIIVKAGDNFEKAFDQYKQLTQQGNHNVILRSEDNSIIYKSYSHSETKSNKSFSFDWKL
jgi:hypothetical protein